jgi:D-amino-acid dehydrogenase
MKVAVVGGGVIGAAAAYSLRRAGADVVLLERDRCGQATSLGNAGWVTPANSAPLPGPGVVVQALKWMRKPDSPLVLRPTLRPSFLAWSWRFIRASARPRHLAGMKATLALNSRTLELYDRLRADGVEFEMHTGGIVMACLTQEAADHEAEVFEELRHAGFSGDVAELDGDGLRAVEPALSDAVLAGFHIRDERFVRPDTLTRGLVDALVRDGGTVVENVEIRKLVRANGSWRLDSPGVSYEADRVVVAAGIWSSALLAPFGAKLRLEPAKGYSVTAPGEGTPPVHAVGFMDAKVACSPYDGALRLTSTLELGSKDLSLDRHRLDLIADAAATYLRDWRPGPPELEWAGFRPLAPDGLPSIGRVPGAEHLYAATGHAMLGVTLAPATAEALVPLVLEDELPDVLQPFRLDRPL